MKVDLVVVGAGFSGAVIAERAARLLSWKVLVVEQRGHVAGNAHDDLDQHGVMIHSYGPHIFHTNSEKVWSYLSAFTEWRPYVHRVCARIDDQLVPLPINLTSLTQLFPQERARSVTAALLGEYGFGSSVPVLRLMKSRNPVLRHAAAELRDRVYAAYTMKQWELRPEELDPSVTGRVPIRVDYDDRYFTDRFQGMPRDGYTSLVQQILAHPNIEVVLGTDFHEIACNLRYRRLVYTGPIDRFFDYRHGALPYRSLRFDLRHHAVDRVQETGVVTYPDDRPYTRSCEFKILTGRESRGTTVSYEYPQPHVPGETTPYYPIPMPETRARYQRYAEDARGVDNVLFCGRLGSYQYLNMDQAVAQALKTSCLL
jgi:UDP-galactopyranose mutase